MGSREWEAFFKRVADRYSAHGIRFMMGTYVHQDGAGLLLEIQWHDLENEHRYAHKYWAPWKTVHTVGESAIIRTFMAETMLEKNILEHF